MYSLFTNVSLLSKAIFPNIHKSFHQGSITTTYWLILLLCVSENGFFWLFQTDSLN